MRLSAGDTVLVASHNEGKVREIRALLAPFGLSVTSASEHDLPEPDETEATFEGNARLKAVAAARASGLPSLSDDSGLEVDALGGAPGIYSARWAGPSKDFTLAMEKVARELADRHALSPDQRRANFTCALCLAFPPGPNASPGALPETSVFLGKVHGQVVWPPRGDRGFGYDPMFVPDGHDITFGEMEPDAKHAMSHRADAFRHMVASLLPEQGP